MSSRYINIIYILETVFLGGKNKQQQLAPIHRNVVEPILNFILDIAISVDKVRVIRCFLFVIFETYFRVTHKMADTH